MVGIVTKYFGPTDCRGSRIVAEVSDRTKYPPAKGRAHYRLTVSYPHELSGEETFAYPATLLARRLEWIGPADIIRPGVYVPIGSVEYVYEPTARDSNEFTSNTLRNLLTV
jgi:hypothetical protein